MENQPVDAELFPRTAPAWNCIDYPGEGMHYMPRSNAGCAWCGKKHDQVVAEIAERLERETARGNP